MNRQKLSPTLQRLLCMSLVLVLLLGVMGCVDPAVTTAPTTTAAPNTTAPTQPQTAPATQPPTQPATQPPTQPATQPATEPPTQPATQPTEPATDPNALVYELTQADVDEFYALLAECEALALAGEDVAAIEEKNVQLDEQLALMDVQHGIATVLYYSDMDDEATTEQYMDCVEILTQAQDAYIQMVRRIYLSDSPAKEELFADWTEEDIAQLMAYEDEVAQLKQRNAQIDVDYAAATSDSVRIPLYIEFVQNNNRIAEVFGYDNYYTYASELSYQRDFGTEELAQMRQYAKTYLVPALDVALENFYASFYALSSHRQNQVAEFLYNDYDALSKDYIGAYLAMMPQSMQDHVDKMLTADSLFTNSSSAYAGAFTIALGERSYCFFGPGCATSSTVIHEAGHYYASRYADLNSIPLDLAETHSQGNEMLLLSSLRHQMPLDQYEALVNYRMYNDIATILVCLMVDEFEQRVYSTDLTGFTAQDFDAIMTEVSQFYFPPEGRVENPADMKNYWRLVVVQQPVYYISYAVSGVSAIDLYTMATEDMDAAIAAYQSLCEQPLEDQGFLANITAAGLHGPFQEEFYQEFLQMLEDMI